MAALPDRHASTAAIGGVRASRPRCGVVLALLPWLSSKYTLMMAALAALALGRVWLPMPDEAMPDAPAADARELGGHAPLPLAQRLRVSLALGLPMVVSVALWMAFFYWIWGSPLPSVVYGAQRPVRWEYFVKGGPGPAVRPGIRHRSGRADLRGGVRRPAGDARRRRARPAASRRRS